MPLPEDSGWNLAAINAGTTPQTRDARYLQIPPRARVRFASRSWDSPWAGAWDGGTLATELDLGAGPTAATGYTGSVGYSGSPAATGTGIVVDTDHPSFPTPWSEMTFYDGWVSGNGTTAALAYTYTLVDFNDLPSVYGAPLAAVHLISPSEVRHVVFNHCRFRTNNTGDIYIDIPPTATVIFNRCTFDGSTASSTGARINVVSGTVTFNGCRITNLASATGLLRKGGTNAHVYWNDLYVDNSAAAGWGGGGGIFVATAAGGTLAFDRATIDPRSTTALFGVTYPMNVTMNRVMVNPAYAVLGGIICTNTDNLLAAWDPYTLTATDCTFRTGPASYWGSYMGGVTGFANARGVAHWTFNRCEFISNIGYPSALATFGPNSGTSTTHTYDINFNYCRFRNPIVPIDGTNTIMVNTARVIALMCRVANVNFFRCWVDEAAEDAYEFIQAIQNCSVTYCGGENVNGNMVDFYNGGTSGVNGSTSPWNTAQGNLGGHQINNIVGNCRSDAVIVENHWGIAIDNIDVNNSSDNSTSAPGIAISMVRLHSYGSSPTVPPLNGVTVGTSIGESTHAVDGKRVELTYEIAAARTAAQTTPGDCVWYEDVAGDWVQRNAGEGDATPHIT